MEIQRIVSSKHERPSGHLLSVVQSKRNRGWWNRQAVDEKEKDRMADPDLVAVLETALRHRRIVDVRAVGAAQIPDGELAILVFDETMLPGDAAIRRQTQRARIVATDRTFAIGQRDGRAFQRPGAND